MKVIGYALVLIIGLVIFGWTPAHAAAPLPTGRWFNSPPSVIGTPPLPTDASVSTIAVDNQDRIWIGTFDHGIAMFDGYTWTRYTSTDGLISDQVQRITAIGGGIWIATEVGVSLYAPTANSWINYTAAGTSPNGLPDNYIYAVAENPSNNPIVGFTTYLFATRGDGVADCALLSPDDLDCVYYTKANTSNGLADDFVYDIEVAANGDLWFATGLGVSRLVGSDDWTAFTSAAQAPGCPAISQSSDIAIDRVRNRVWVALANAVYGIDDAGGVGACMYDVAANEWFFFNAGNSGLLDNTVLDLAVDAEGRAWFATNPEDAGDPGGTYVCTWVDGPNANDDTCYWEAYDTGDGLGSIAVNAVAASLDRLWFGTQNAGVSSYALRWAQVADEAKVFATLPNMLYAGSTTGLKRFDYASSTWSTELTNVDVTAILALAPNDIWVATAANGLRRWNGTNWQSITAQNRRLASNNLLALARDSLGRIWVGTSDAGVSVFDPAANAWTRFDAASVLPGNRVQSLAADTAGGMWVGTNTGLVHYTGATWESVATASLPATNIQALLLDISGNLWAGTPSGAARHSSGSWTTFDLANSGLLDNNVQTIVMGTGNHVWFATQAGASRYDGVAWQTYRRRNSGLDNERVHALAIDDQNNLWASGPAYAQSGVNVPASILFRDGGDEPLGQPAPAIVNFTPTAALAGALVTINGNSFTPGSIVEFAGKQGLVQVNPVTVNATSIQVRVPASAIFGKIRVRNATGTATSAADFSPQPQISDVEEDYGVVGSEVTIHGLNLASPGFTEVRFGDGAFSSLHVLETTPQLLRVRVPADATTGQIQVRTPAGTATSAEQYAVSANGLVIFGYEVHQGLPQYPLVAGKSTVVRLFVGTSDPNGVCAYADRGVLQVLRAGENTPKGYLANLANGGVINQGEFCNQSKDVTKAGSIDFVIPGADLQSGAGYFMGIGLSIGFINVATRDIGQYFFPATDDVRIHASVPGWINDAGQAAALEQTMTTQYRTYPVRDGWGLIGTPVGFQMVFRDYPICDGTATAYCGSGDLWDFWQENPNGQLRACTIETTLDKGADDGSRLTFAVDNVAAGKRETRTFYARLRPGQTLPANPLTLLNLSATPGGVSISATTSNNLPTQRCGGTTIPGVIAYTVRFTNTTGSGVNARAIIDYNETAIALYGAGGIMAVSGNTFATMLTPGTHWAGGGWLPSRHDSPADKNYNGLIDGSDIGFYMIEGEVWDATTGRFVRTTNPNAIRPGDLIRNFGDANRNNQHDSGESKSLAVQQGANGQTLLWNIPYAYMTDYNATAAIKTQFSGMLLLPGINPYMGPGQGRCGTTNGRCTHPGYQFWTNVSNTSVFGQELGHSLGMVHADSPNNDGGSHTVNPQITYVPAGYDTLGRRVVLGPSLLSIMWGTEQSPGQNTFFEPFEYHQAFVYLRSQSNQQASAAAVDAGELFYMAGTVSGDHEVTLDHTYVRNGLTPTSADPLSDYVLRFKQGATILAEHRFPVKFDAYDEDHHQEVVDAPVGVFAVITPYPAGTQTLEIWHGSHPVLVRTVSANAPTVQVQSPNGGETIPGNGTLTVQWQGSDVDGGDLHYTVRYSPDNGASWITLAAAVMGNSLSLPAKSIPGSTTALIEVTVTDGFKTASDRANAVFQLGKKPPLGATILNPLDGATFVYDVPIFLVGTALDPEDGVLGGNQLVWSSDLEGSLGSGDSVTATLTTGVHRLTLLATDSDSQTVTATATITIAADFDRDGLSDDYETQITGLEWWDPTDAGQDTDNDGLTARAEAAFGTDPNNPDTDGDGVNDGDEATAGTSPLDSSSQPSSIQLLTSRFALTYDVIVGTAAFDDALLLMSSTTQTLTWSATENASWLTITPANGTTTGEVALRINPAGLDAGIYTGTLRITPAGAPVRTLPVQLTVLEPLSTDTSIYIPSVQN